LPSNQLATFKYDPFGRRIQKSSASGTTNYLYDGDNTLEEVDPSGNVLARYAQSLSIEVPLAQLRSGTTSYYGADGLGSITSLSNSSGAIVNTYNYNSFGNLTASTGAIVNSLRYTGREFDSETGLHYYRARYYDQSVGRFISEDPIGFGGSGPNVYEYVFNRPINLTDPNGMNTCDCSKPPAGPMEVPWADIDADVHEAMEAGGPPFETVLIFRVADPS